MLHHISIAVNHPQPVAEVLAQIFQGRAVPFPPHPGSYMVLALDEFGTAIELYPIDTVMVPQVGFQTTPQPATGYTPFHAAISVPISLEQIERIAEQAGWPIYVCDRDGLFNVIELWIENRLMVELLTPAMAAKYLQLFQPDQLEANLQQLALANR
jgi:hypothetical protein